MMLILLILMQFLVDYQFKIEYEIMYLELDMIFFMFYVYGGYVFSYNYVIQLLVIDFYYNLLSIRLQMQF